MMLPAAVFVDRDGVINEEVDLVYRVEQLRLIPGSAEAIRRLNAVGVPVIVVTNQPVVARGFCTEEGLALIHERLRELLRENDAKLDAIYYCPHHEKADDPKYRTVCDDRKPGIGMLRRAAEDFKIELRDCVLIGDRFVDIKAGRAAGSRTILVQTGFAGRDAPGGIQPDRVCRDLSEAVAWLIDAGESR